MSRLSRIVHRVRRLLLLAQVPLVVPALCAFCAWGISHVTDRLSAAPTIVYSCEVSNHPPGLAWTCTVYNASASVRFGDLKFFLRFPDQSSGKISSVEIVWKSTSSKDASEDQSFSAQEATFHVSALHPGQEVQLTAEVTEDPRKPALRFEAAAPVLAVEANAVTWVVRHESGMIICLTLIAAFIVFITLLLKSAEEVPKEARKYVVVVRLPDSEAGADIKDPGTTGRLQGDEKDPIRTDL